MNDCLIVNILDLTETIGENEVKNILSEFTCPKNEEIESFLRKNAIELAKRKMSITYLVFSNDENQYFLGYFTLTHKSSLVPLETLSKTNQKKLSMHSKLDETTQKYDVSAFLIAQFGKNYAVENGKFISGNELMDFVFVSLKNVQHLIGGGIAFLECEEKDKLLNFYTSEHNRFKIYGKRFSEKEQKFYIQLLRLF